LTGEGIEPQWKPIEKIWLSPVAQGISSVNGSLIFAAVEDVHAGQYMCSVNNGIGSGLSKVVHLHVNGKSSYEANGKTMLSIHFLGSYLPVPRVSYILRHLVIFVIRKVITHIKEVYGFFFFTRTVKEN